jgi:hypothetical protein
MFAKTAKSLTNRDFKKNRRSRINNLSFVWRLFVTFPLNAEQTMGRSRDRHWGLEWGKSVGLFWKWMQTLIAWRTGTARVSSRWKAERFDFQYWGKIWWRQLSFHLSAISDFPFFVLFTHLNFSSEHWFNWSDQNLIENNFGSNEIFPAVDDIIWGNWEAGKRWSKISYCRDSHG